MKLAVSGKGGVGKTTIAAAMALELARRGKGVLAIDADPDANMASALGMSHSPRPKPIAELEDIIEERTGAKPGTTGGIFRLNPRVDDLPERFAVPHPKFKDLRLMIMGTIKKGGSGCICPESALLRALVNHLVLFQNEAVIMDMEAGIEHLGRATASGMDRLIIVVEPGKRSVQTALKIRELAADIGLHRLSVVLNKVRNKSDEDFICSQLKDMDLIASMPFDDSLIRSDMDDVSPCDVSPALRELAGKVLDSIG